MFAIPRGPGDHTTLPSSSVTWVAADARTICRRLDGKIAEVDLVADPERLRKLDLAVLDDVSRSPVS
jgi:hypothetical protein